LDGRNEKGEKVREGKWKTPSLHALFMSRTVFVNEIFTQNVLEYFLTFRESNQFPVNGLNPGVPSRDGEFRA
jgi:hypothetical protein